MKDVLSAPSCLAVGTLLFVAGSGDNEPPMKVGLNTNASPSI
jgi:hypothetical protein